MEEEPVIEASGGETIEQMSARANRKRLGRQKKMRIVFIAIIGVLVVGGAAAGVYFLSQNRGGGENETSEGEDVPEGETSEMGEVYTTEEYIAKQEALIGGSEAGDAFIAKLDLAGYYVTLEEYDKAGEIMFGITTEGLSTEQSFRYYNVLSRYYEAIGDTEKRDAALALAADYRNKMQLEYYGSFVEGETSSENSEGEEEGAGEASEEGAGE